MSNWNEGVDTGIGENVADGGFRALKLVLGAKGMSTRVGKKEEDALRLYEQR